MDALTTLLLSKAKKGGGVTPTGTIEITQNGVVDVTEYATADVKVMPNYFNMSFDNNGCECWIPGIDGMYHLQNSGEVTIPVERNTPIPVLFSIPTGQGIIAASLMSFDGKSTSSPFASESINYAEMLTVLEDGASVTIDLLT